MDAILRNLENDGFIDEAKKVAYQLLQNCDRIIIFGMGGSIMVGQALFDINSNSKIIFCDTIDPKRFEVLVANDPYKTGFVTISKSGTTIETLAQIYTVIKLYPDLPKKHFVVITQKIESPLMRLAQKHNWFILEHPLDIGGRFSAFTIVGVFPCILMGLDPVAFRQGARDHFVSKSDFMLENYQKGKSIHVLLSYSDFCGGLMQWWRQLMAESLGKKDLKKVSHGITPVVGKGTADEHSQLQLYLDGPQDKFFTFLSFSYNSNLSAIELNEKTTAMGDIFNAHLHATLNTLKEQDFGVRHMHFAKFDEYVIGQLMVGFMLEVIDFALRININPFDQPSVESVKKRALLYL